MELSETHFYNFNVINGNPDFSSAHLFGHDFNCYLIRINGLRIIGFPVLFISSRKTFRFVTISIWGMRRYRISPIIRSDPLVNLRDPEFVPEKNFVWNLLRAVSYKRDAQKKKKKNCTVHKFANFSALRVALRISSRSSRTSRVALVSLVKSRGKFTKNHVAFPLSPVLIGQFKCALDRSRARRQVDRSKQPRVNCCVQASLYIWFPLVFFLYTSRSTWRTTRVPQHHTPVQYTISDSTRCLCGEYRAREV